jgi:hypothetical protein
MWQRTVWWRHQCFGRTCCLRLQGRKDYQIPEDHNAISVYERYCKTEWERCYNWGLVAVSLRPSTHAHRSHNFIRQHNFTTSMHGATWALTLWSIQFMYTTVYIHITYEAAASIIPRTYFCAANNMSRYTASTVSDLFHFSCVNE